MELNAVELDAEAKGRRGASTDCGGDFCDESCSVLHGAAVDVGAAISTRGDELGKKIAVSCSDWLASRDFDTGSVGITRV